ncbi:MAG: glycosyltransferase [Paludibacteraceae bacterium]|nr:glycosyltransferase [Paludibacteraceae bacterium]
MEKPLVTIKCVAYNEADYIRRTLDGFVMQKTNFPFFALVHDDASSDGTDAIIREYAAKYPDIIKGLYEEPGNNLFSRQKLDAQMNEWVLDTGCKYVAMCEGDDWWIDPNKLQKQVDYMEAHPECVLCFTDCHTANDKGEITTQNLLRKHLLIPKNFEEHLMNAGYIAPPTWVYRADASKRIGSYDAYTDDTFAMALDLFQQGNVHYMDEPTAVYSVRQGSVATQQDIHKHWEYVKGIGETQLLMADKYGCSEELKQRILFQRYVTSMLLAIEAGDEDYMNEAFAYFKQKGYYMKWFAESCKEYVRYKQQYLQIRLSTAYRLGKALLKPFMWMKRK